MPKNVIPLKKLSKIKAILKFGIKKNSLEIINRLFISEKISTLQARN